MKTLLTLFIAIITSIGLQAQDIKKDQEDIKKVIQGAYIEGLHNKGDLQLTKEGFHPGFNLLILKNNMLDKLPIYNWIEYAEMRREKDPAPPAEDKRTVCEYEFIDVTGNSAVAKIKLSKEGKLIFTDYLSLYKFDDGWKIVGKIYYRHPDKESK